MENISKVEHAYAMSRDNMKNKQQALYLFVVFLLDHCAVCYFYGFWLPLCHLQNLIISFWDFLALVALWWSTANVTFRNPSISFFSYLIKKIVYWLGSMFGVGDTKYMREAWWPSSSPSQWIDGWALVGELQPLLWRVIKQMLYNNFLGNLRMAHTTSIARYHFIW